MQFIHAEEYLNQGDTVRVALDKQANVRIFDGINFSNFRNGRQAKYYGGRALKSPIDIIVPYTGTWHVVIDLGGARGTIRHSIQYLKR
ncbi:DUF1883 domain-containing protein [Bacillus sp. EB106-08-02-XG196]|uniref:DUF1883 domain-containing protein n=1 Tax=Bacillus sp. EB106-08-02-XG196 TaxID=2737049 RepID=UPI0015C4B13F|nr:DUF1883 domain-containing protein [Bacillus sp. EB106-08-02-XG196]NWQ44688.1 DUF1883 domain-containing protein [Bacillus sp. EB106-08-02-XG196]